MRHLRAHLLPILRPELDNAGQFSTEDLHSIVIDRLRLYTHATARFNFTSYDVRRDQDLINPRTDKSGIMVYTPDTNGTCEPWAYARVLGIYHAMVGIPGKVKLQRVEFLHVRWMIRDETWTSGAHVRHLPRVHYIPEEDNHAFGIVDPAHIIRGCHLIPAFHHGRSEDMLGPSAARDSPIGDWKFYYVNRYVCFNRNYCAGY